MDKKNLVINCDMCDTRRVDEESLAKYENILINADGLVVDKRSKAVLNRLPVTCNVEFTAELEEGMDVNIETHNGHYEIGSGKMFDSEGKSVLCVNGNLMIKPGAEENLKHYLHIVVNGCVSYPESLSGSLVSMSVNGVREPYPDDCVLLKRRFVIDRYFPLRARVNGKYFARKKVILTDNPVNAAMMAEKGVHFVTEKMIVSEEKLEDAIQLVDEDVTLAVVPSGYAYVGEDVVLSEALLAKYGTRLYIDGNLTLRRESTPFISKLEGLHAEGAVELLADQVDIFRNIQAEYREMKVIKGRIFCNKAKMTLDDGMLDASPEGVMFKNCAVVNIDREVTAQKILDMVQMQNCAMVSCTPKQRSAVEMVSVNVAKINDGTGDEEKGVDGLNPGERFKQLLDSKIINADKYVL